MRYEDDPGIEGISPNGEPAAEATLDMLGKLARGFLEDARVNSVQQYTIIVKDVGEACFQRIITLAEDDADEVETIMLNMDDEDCRKIFGIQFTDGEHDSLTFGKDIEPREAVLLISQFLASDELACEDTPTIQFLEAIMGTLRDDTTSSEKRGLSRDILGLVPAVRNKIMEKVFVSVVSMRADLPTTEGMLHVESHLVLPRDGTPEAKAMADMVQATHAILSVQLTDIDSGYGNAFILNDQDDWYMFAVNPPADEYMGDPESYVIDATPGESHARRVTEALVEASFHDITANL
jgi:hypothetical protein